MVTDGKIPVITKRFLYIISHTLLTKIGGEILKSTIYKTTGVSIVPVGYKHYFWINKFRPCKWNGCIGCSVYSILSIIYEN